MTDKSDKPNKGGRPRVPEPGSSVSVYLREKDHDRLIRLANEQNQSISALVRTLLKLKL